MSLFPSIGFTCPTTNHLICPCQYFFTAALTASPPRPFCYVCVASRMHVSDVRVAFCSPLFFFSCACFALPSSVTVEALNRTHRSGLQDYLGRIGRHLRRVPLSQLGPTLFTTAFPIPICSSCASQHLLYGAHKATVQILYFIR